MSAADFTGVQHFAALAITNLISQLVAARRSGASESGAKTEQLSALNKVEYIIVNSYNTSHKLYEATIQKQRGLDIPLLYMLQQ